MQKGITAFFVAILLCIISLWAGNRPWFYAVTDEAGLPSNEVYEVVQDEFGYLWIACDAGLFRYDGNTYAYFSSSLQNGRSVSSLTVDSKNRIWCKNFNGQIFRTQGDSLLLICDVTGEVTSTFSYVLDDSDRVYVPVKQSIRCFSSAGDSVTSFAVNPKTVSSPNPLRSIFYTDSAFYVHVVGAGLYAVDPDTKKVTAIDTSALLRQNTLGILFFEEKNQTRFLLNENTTLTYSLGTITASGIVIDHQYDVDKNNPRVHSVCHDRKGQLWLCTATGAYAYDSTVTSFDSPRTHNGEKISWLLNDREGNYWFATLNNGLLVSPSLELQRLTPVNSSLPDEHITALRAVNNTLVAGLYSGELVQINPADETVTALNSHVDQSLVAVKKIVPLGNEMIVSRGLIQLVNGTHSGERLLPSHARDMVVARDSVYLIAPELFGAVAVADLSRGLNAPFRVIRSTGGRSIAWNAQEQTMYIAFNDGVYTWQNEKLELIRENNSAFFANSLSCSSEIVWAGSVNDGIVAIKNKQIVSRYPQSGSPEDLNVRVVAAYGDTVIGCSNSTLYAFVYDHQSYNAYNRSHGINPKDISSIQLYNHEVWLGTNKGILHFPFGMPSVNTVAPPIAITAFENNGEALATGITNNLPADAANITLHFSTASFRSRGSFHYEYRLIGLDTSWTAIPGNNSFVTFTTIAPGDYTFELVAVNESGTRSINPAAVSFSVEAPVWQSWWFYLLSTLMIIGVIAAIAVLRVRAARKKAELNARIALSQLTALKAQMNPHFMYNALNSIQDLVLQHDVKNSTIYLGKFSNLMRKVLDASGADSITVEEEMELLELYLSLEQLRLGDDFTYSLRKADNIEPELLIPPLLIQPFVENALKHGLLHKKGSKSLSVELTLNDALVCTITDNGIGRVRSAEIRKRLAEKHASFATQATEKRIELLNVNGADGYAYEIIDLYENGNAAGTKVVLTIPLSGS